jgi:hypothetical protein
MSSQGVGVDPNTNSPGPPTSYTACRSSRSSGALCGARNNRSARRPGAAHTRATWPFAHASERLLKWQASGRTFRDAAADAAASPQLCHSFLLGLPAGSRDGASRTEKTQAGKGNHRDPTTSHAQTTAPTQPRRARAQLTRLARPDTDPSQVEPGTNER